MVLHTVLAVAGRIKDFVQFLIRTGNVAGENDVHLIGQSLGWGRNCWEQFTGDAGKLIGSITGQIQIYLQISMWYITCTQPSLNSTFVLCSGPLLEGTDPAGPGFQNISAQYRLSKEDGRFVDSKNALYIPHHGSLHISIP
jgi:hypothetical protein